MKFQFVWFVVLGSVWVGTSMTMAQDITGGGNAQGDQVVNQSDQLGANVTGNDGQIEAPANVTLQTSEDVRNQGFVGATAEVIQNGRESDGSDTSAFDRIQGFIGAASETAGPQLVNGGTFGGNVNNTGTQFSGGGGGNLGRGGQAGLGAGSGNGFRVTRRSIRARVVPRFYSPPKSNAVIRDQFVQQYRSQPTSFGLSNNFRISMEGRTAYINGIVSSQFESQRIERQLRLSPGISKIVNQLQIGN
ncbi:MAG: BON domain-containing protein [Planctomycetota bacterium]